MKLNYKSKQFHLANVMISFAHMMTAIKYKCKRKQNWRSRENGPRFRRRRDLIVLEEIILFETIIYVEKPSVFTNFTFGETLTLSKLDIM